MLDTSSTEETRSEVISQFLLKKTEQNRPIAQHCFVGGVCENQSFLIRKMCKSINLAYLANKQFMPKLRVDPEQMIWWKALTGQLASVEATVNASTVF